MDLDVCDIDERKLLGTVLHTGHQGPGRIDGCKDRYAGLDGVSADNKAVVAALRALGRGVDSQVDLVAQDRKRSAEGDDHVTLSFKVSHVSTSCKAEYIEKVVNVSKYPNK